MNRAKVLEITHLNHTREEIRLHHLSNYVSVQDGTLHFSDELGMNGGFSTRNIIGWRVR